MEIVLSFEAPSKNGMSNQFWFDVGPPSTTLAQY